MREAKREKVFTSTFRNRLTIDAFSLRPDKLEQPPLLVQSYKGSTAGLGYLEVNVICPCKSPHWIG
jgi:hypothetical protein